MAPFNDRLRTGALAAGAFALGATGAATAAQLINSGDVENGSLKKKDLSNKAIKSLGAPALLASGDFTNTTPLFYAPGTDVTLGSAESIGTVLPPEPKAGYLVRGLAVSSTEAKAVTPSAATEVTLMVDGDDTLSCTTGDSGLCTDSGKVTAPAGSALLFRVVNPDTFSNATATISLAPAG